MQLDFKVEEQTLRLVSKQTVVADSLNYLTCKFEFSSEWDNIGKTAVFVSPTDAVYTVILENDRCDVPWEVIQSPSFQVSVFGGDRITANLITVNVTKSGYFEGDFSEEPTPDMYTQLLDRLNKLEKVETGLSKIYKITIGDDGVTTFTFDKDIDGKSFKLDSVAIKIECSAVPNTTKYWRICGNGNTSDTLLFYFKPDSTGSEIVMTTERMCENFWHGSRSRNNQSTLSNSPMYAAGYINKTIDYVESLYITLSEIPVGSVITICGRRVG
jgi:hypothetical protein